MILETLVAFTILVNSNRATSTPVTPDYVLSQRAQVRAETLCKTGQWSHDGWEKSFEGLPGGYIGENLARGFATPKEAHEALMKSPMHKANIVDKNFKKIGIGASCGIIVELFR